MNDAMTTTFVPSSAGFDAAPARSVRNHRLFVLADITSLEGGVLEPDDGQSMVRLMLYANDLDIEGLAATSNLGHGQRTRPDLILRVVDAYGRDFANLRRYDARFPHPDALRQLVFDGQPIAGPAVPVPDSIGPGRDTGASRALVRAVDRDDPASRPLWIIAWGGTADLAQALWSVRETRSAADLATFVSRIRVAEQTKPFWCAGCPLPRLRRRRHLERQPRQGARTPCSPPRSGIPVACPSPGARRRSPESRVCW